jgi:hypothetical protein
LRAAGLWKNGKAARIARKCVDGRNAAHDFAELCCGGNTGGVRTRLP